MPGYKLYCLDGAGRITGVAELIEAPSDEDALEAARRLDRGRCEIWQGGRLVAVIPGPRSAG